MGYTPYQTHVLIPDRARITLHGLAEHLQQCRKWAVTVIGNTATLERDGYCFGLSLENGPHVPVEHQDILELLGLPGTGTDYPERLIWSGKTPDPDMDFFNDHVFLLERVSAYLPEAIFFDPQGGEQIEV